MPVTVALPRIDPQPGVHRQTRPPFIRVIGDFITVRLPSRQERRVRDEDYPHRGDTQPSAYAQGWWRGRVPGWPLGYSMLDYGPVPQRVPHLWKDATRFWDGPSQRGFTQQNYRQQWPHFVPPYKTRGYRSISGVITSQGPTASRVRVPAVFAPSTGG